VRKDDYLENKSRSGERWVGRAVAKHLRLNAKDPKDDWQIQRALRELENRGVIAYESKNMGADSDYKTRSFAVVGEWRRPL
jgi:hypothetical protein